MRLGYVMNSLVPITLTLPIESGRESMLQICLVKRFQLVGTKKRNFSAIVSTLWNILPQEVKEALTLWAFWSSIKMQCDWWLEATPSTSFNILIFTLFIILFLSLFFKYAFYTTECFYCKLSRIT